MKLEILFFNCPIFGEGYDFVSLIVNGQTVFPDPSFKTDDGFNGEVSCILFQPDNKIVVIGLFSNYNGVSRQKIARLNSDGSLDLSFNPGIGFFSSFFSPNALTIQADGKYIVGGQFTGYDTLTNLKNLVRINPDGTPDLSFKLTGSGVNGVIYDIYVQSDGKLILGGAFSTYNNNFLSGGVMRINTDGSIDTTFKVGTGFNMPVFKVEGLSDGKVLAGGVFNSFWFQNFYLPRMNLARLNQDGSLDTTFNFNNMFPGAVYDWFVEPDGRILVVGSFGEGSIIRLLPNGEVDTTFKVIEGFGFSTNMRALSVVKDDKNRYLVGGEFFTYNNDTSKFIVRILPDGSFDTLFNVGSSFNNRVTDIQLQTDGKILVSGSFTNFQNTNANGIIRLIGQLPTQIEANKNDNSSIKLYPNPCFNSLFIQLTKNNPTPFEIYNSNGQIVKTGFINDPISSIDISNFIPGIYFFKTPSEQQGFIKK